MLAQFPQVNHMLVRFCFKALTPLSAIFMSEIDDLIELIEQSTEDHILVPKVLLLALAAPRRGATALQVALAAWGANVPDLDGLQVEDQFFRSKVALICRSLGITQRGLAAKSTVDQGDLSKFQAGLKEFGPDRKQRLVNALREMRDDPTLRR